MSSRLFVLDLAEGRVFSVKPDGSDKKVIATGGRMPDGVAIDIEAGHLYWTNMCDRQCGSGPIRPKEVRCHVSSVVRRIGRSSECFGLSFCG